MLSETRTQVRIAIPVSLTTLCRVMVFTTDAAFIGHLGTPELAAANLCGTIFDALIQFGFGASIALATLCAQAHGVGNPRLVVAYFLIGLTSCAAISLIFIPVLLFATVPLLRVIGVADEVAQHASVFNRIYCLRYLPVVIFHVTRTYLTAQDDNTASLLVSLVTTALNVVLNYLAIVTLGLGLEGAALSSLITSVIQMVALFAYVCCYYDLMNQIREGTALFTKHRLHRFAEIAIGTFASNAADSWVFTAVVIMAGLLGTSEVAAQGILYNLWSIMWSLYFGVGQAVQTRVSQTLGEGDSQSAFQSAVVGCLQTLGLSSLIGFIYWWTCPTACMLYTTDETLIQYHYDLRWLVVGAYGCSITAQTLLLILDGCGRSTLSAGVAVLASGAVLLPLSYVFAFYLRWGLRGLWWASVSCEAFRVVVACGCVGGLRWDIEAIHTRQRMENAKQDRDSHASLNSTFTE